jgi:hypothetical protein
MGTLLLDRGVPVDHCLEGLCVSEPERMSREAVTQNKYLRLERRGGVLRPQASSAKMFWRFRPAVVENVLGQVDRKSRAEQR